MDEVINIPTKAEERSMIQISFRNIQDRHNPESAPKFTANPRSTVFPNPRIRSIYRKRSTIRALLRPNPSIRKTIHPLLKCQSCHPEMHFWHDKDANRFLSIRDGPLEKWREGGGEVGTFSACSKSTASAGFFPRGKSPQQFFFGGGGGMAILILTLATIWLPGRGFKQIFFLSFTQLFCFAVQIILRGKHNQV